MAKNVKEFFEKHKTRRQEHSFHSQLGVNKNQKIPMELLVRIKNAHVGEVIYNEDAITKAKKYIKVTELMQKKARFLFNMRKDKRYWE